MRKACFVTPVVVLAAILTCASTVTSRAAQQAPADAGSGANTAASNPRDFSGHWDRTSSIVSFSNVPTGAARENTGVQEAPFTPEGRAMYAANRPGYGPRRSIQRNDPMGRCEPLGLVRHLTTEILEPHSTFEIVQTPGRILQLFEYRHDRREVWMDGRTLPALSVAEPKWNGHSVGRLEGDTLVVESIGFDERSWMDKFGYPHSEQMRLEERYRRIDRDTLELVMTITDPVVYTRPWVSDTKRFQLNRPKARSWAEQIYCVPSEEFPFQKLIESGNVVEP
jgi:hypothetical protein